MELSSAVRKLTAWGLGEKAPGAPEIRPEGSRWNPRAPSQKVGEERRREKPVGPLSLEHDPMGPTVPEDGGGTHVPQNLHALHQPGIQTPQVRRVRELGRSGRFERWVVSTQVAHLPAGLYLPPPTP